MKKLKNKSLKWWLGCFACFLLFSIVTIFGYSKMNFVFTGVQIEADLAKEKNSSLLQIVGKAENSIYLSLNGREIFIDQEGNFSEKIGLLPGFSIITLEARDKFGKVDFKKFSLIYDEKTETLAFLDQKDLSL